MVQALQIDWDRSEFLYSVSAKVIALVSVPALGAKKIPQVSMERAEARRSADFDPRLHARRLMAKHVAMQQPFTWVVEDNGNFSGVATSYQ